MSLKHVQEKLIADGPKTLTHADLLAILYQTEQITKKPSKIHSLRELVHLAYPAFCQLSGMGNIEYCTLQAAIEIGHRYFQETLMSESPCLSHSQATLNFLRAEFSQAEHEIVGVLYLTPQHRVIKFKKLFHGTLQHVDIYPREIIKEGLKYNAGGIILAHNHPSGDATPSQMDQSMTRQLKKILSWVDIHLLDHIIIAGHHYFSFAEAKQL